MSINLDHVVALTNEVEHYHCRTSHGGSGTNWPEDFIAQRLQILTRCSSSHSNAFRSKLHCDLVSIFLLKESAENKHPKSFFKQDLHERINAQLWPVQQ